MKINKFAYIALFLILGTIQSSAKNPFLTKVEVPWPTKLNVTSQRYSNLDYGLKIQVRNDVSDNQIVNLSELTKKELKTFPDYTFTPSLGSAVEESLSNMCSNLGFSIGGPSAYTLRVTIKECRLNVREYNVKKKSYSATGAMVISWELLDDNYQQVISPTTVTGRSTGTTLDDATLGCLYYSYAQALGDIDFDRIASCLKIAKTAKQEKNKQVTGDGDTALEHTVIRWYIVSSPQGADVSWRVVSSTPDVANTNANFIGTTPYESTEAFDIKGLTYNNSGNVQIEVSCERPGYLTQRKRFNLRQAIDQKEISTKFNLVKEDAE